MEDTKDMGVKLSVSSLLWDLKGVVDSDWAGDKEGRKSVSGWVIFLAGAAIAWGSRGQKVVSLSSF